MTEQVLSSEEVDAILKASRGNSADLSQIVNAANSSDQIDGKHYTYTLGNINELIQTELEKDLTSFLRKRVIIKIKAFNLTKVDALVNDSRPKSVYHIFRIKPTDTFGLILVDYSIMHHAINLLYGGILNPSETIVDVPGKIGVIVAEKISHLCLSSFIHSCKEYGSVSIENIKTTTSAHLASNLGLAASDVIYALELAVFFDEIETPVSILVSENFFMKFIPPKMNTEEFNEKNSWRTAIKSQVEDSLVTVTANLPDVKIKIKDFMNLKEGDDIPINEPTKAYLCLNHLKIFRGTAAQANEKRVIKIISQI